MKKIQQRSWNGFSFKQLNSVRCYGRGLHPIMRWKQYGAFTTGAYLIDYILQLTLMEAVQIGKRPIQQQYLRFKG